MEAEEWDRSPDSYRSGKREKVWTTTNMVSSSPRGGGERTSRRDEDVSLSVLSVLLSLSFGGNIVEEIPLFFRFYFFTASSCCCSPPPLERHIGDS